MLDWDKRRLQAQYEAAVRADLPPADPLLVQSLAVTLLKRFTVLAGLLSSVSRSGRAFIRLAVLRCASRVLVEITRPLSQGLSGINLFLTAFESIRYPTIIFAEWLVGHSAPLKPTRAARFAFAAASLALIVIGLAFPGALPAVAILGAAVSLMNSLWMLGSALYYRHQYRREAVELMQLREWYKSQLRQQQDELAQLWQKSPDGQLTPAQFNDIQDKINRIQSLREDARDTVNAYALVQNKLKKKGWKKITDRCAMVGFNFLILSALILMMAMPAAGLVMWGTVAVAIGLFVLGLKVLLPLGNHIKEKMTAGPINNSEKQQATAPTLYPAKTELLVNVEILRYS